MSTCWKCGRELPEGQVECEYGCQDSDNTAAINNYGVPPSLKDFVTIDYSKINTVADVVEFLAAWNGGVMIDRRHPIYQKLKRFTKDAL